MTNLLFTKCQKFVNGVHNVTGKMLEDASAPQYREGFENENFWRILKMKKNIKSVILFWKICERRSQFCLDFLNVASTPQFWMPLLFAFIAEIVLLEC